VVGAEVKQAVDTGPAQPERVVFVMPDSEKPVAPRFIYDEFGYLSASCHWATEGMTAMAVQDVAPDKMTAFRRAKFVNVPREEPPPRRERGDWVIDARKLNEISERLRNGVQ
jgi:hypothetical protein